MNDKQKLGLMHIISSLEQSKNNKPQFLTTNRADLPQEERNKDYIQTIVHLNNRDTLISKYVDFNQEAIDILIAYEAKVQEIYQPVKEQIEEIREELGKEASGFKRRIKALKILPDAIKYGNALNVLKRLTYRQVEATLK
jgi:hypothetical protein